MEMDSHLIRILAVDDHPIFREGIASLLADHSDMQLVAEASSGIEAVRQFRVYKPDITLMDLQMAEMSGLDDNGNPWRISRSKNYRAHDVQW